MKNLIFIFILFFVACSANQQSKSDFGLVQAQLTSNTAVESANQNAQYNSPVFLDERKIQKHFEGRTATFVLLDVSGNKYVRYNERVAAERLSPCSTFKIPNSLIGLETGVIKDADFIIKWNGTKHPFDTWNKDQTLRTAISESVLWYYQELAKRVGEAAEKKYVREISYGNMDTSGGIDKPFWLQSSLTISADEQVEFLRRLHAGELPFSRRSVKIVLDILRLSDENGIVFRGKTGTAGNREKGIATLGWFVGSVTRNGKVYVFAVNIRGGDNPSGRTARKITESILKEMQLL